MKPISYIKIGVKGNIKNPHLKKNNYTGCVKWHQLLIKK
jgi:hypothetical protein